MAFPAKKKGRKSNQEDKLATARQNLQNVFF